MTKPDPIQYTLTEGGMWINWDAVWTDRPKQAHAVRFSDGSIFDMVNGWRPSVEYATTTKRFAIRRHNGRELVDYLVVEIDSSGMSVCWSSHKVATFFDSYHKAFAMIQRLLERYPNIKVVITEELVHE